MFYYKTIHEGGLRYVKDLFYFNGSPLSYIQFCVKFKARGTPFTLLFSLISSIPFNWKSSLQSEVETGPNDRLIQNIFNVKNISMLKYPLLIAPITVPPLACSKWNRQFNFDKDKWRTIFKITFITRS